jgi:hypothetical protein
MRLPGRSSTRIRLSDGRAQKVLCALRDGVLNLTRAKLRDQQRQTFWGACGSQQTFRLNLSALDGTARMSGLSFGAVMRTATIVATMLAEPAPAQTQQQVDWCVNKNSAFSLDRRISGCTAAIISGKWKGPSIAWAY